MLIEVAFRSTMELDHFINELQQFGRTKNADRILHQCRTQRPAGGVKPHRQIFFAFSKLRKMRRGESTQKLPKPVFPPRAPPFRARSCCMLWKCEYVLVGRWILRCWQCNVTPIYTQVESAAPRPNISRQTTGKLSLSSRYPTYGKPLYISP